MPNRLNNWTFKNIVDVLSANFFVLRNVEGSHHYYVGKVGGAICVVEVQFHANKSIPVKTMQHSIVVKSGMPQAYWVRSGTNIKKCEVLRGVEDLRKMVLANG